MLEKAIQLSHKLAECVHACNYCFNACLEEEDVMMMKNCIRLDKECALVCQATLGLIYPGSQFKKEVLDLCEKACESCAEECNKHPMDHCKECARVCEECAKACSEFLS